MHYLKSFFGKIFTFILYFVISATAPSYKVIKGPNKLKEVGKLVKELEGTKVVIVTDRVLRQLGLLEGVEKSLTKEGIPYFIYDGVKPDPTKDMVEEVAEMIKENDADFIVAFGGGSSIDCAKAASGVALNPDLDGYIGLGSILPFTRGNGAVPIIAIPTTAGTGAEITVGAIISDPSTHIKGPAFDPKLVPKIAILDPVLFAGLPPHLTVATSMDALTHLFEGYTNWWRLLYSKKKYDKYMVDGIGLIFENLPVVYKDGSNLDAREAMALASNYGGVMLNKAPAGTVHSIAHNVGGIYGVSHGQACGMILPHYLEHTFGRIYRRLAMLALDLNWAPKNMSKKDRARLVIQKVVELQKEVNFISTSKLIDGSRDLEVVDLAYKEQFTYSCPRFYPKKEIRKILGDLKQ